MKIISKDFERFKDLKKFVKEILPLLKKLKISPILWGSFAYIVYSKDLEMEVRDLDFLIPRKNYESLLSMLKEKKIKYNYVDGWDCIQIFKGNLRIEFDPLEDYPIYNFQEIDFGDFKLTAISLEDLKRRYNLASKDKRVANYSLEKVKDYKIKYKKLQNISKKQ